MSKFQTIVVEELAPLETSGAAYQPLQIFWVKTPGRK